MPATDHIHHVNQAHLTHTPYSHDSLRIHLPFLVRVGEGNSRRLDQVMMGLIAARQACLFEESGDVCTTRQTLISPGGIRLQCC